MAYSAQTPPPFIFFKCPLGAPAGLSPDLTSFHALLKACGGRGGGRRHNRAWCGVAMALLDDIAGKGLAPTAETYHLAVDSLLRGGHKNEVTGVEGAECGGAAGP